MLSQLRLRPSSSGGRPRLDLSAQQWVVAFLIGTATVLAALFGWRGAAIGSTAAFDDRQSISETIWSSASRSTSGSPRAATCASTPATYADYGIAAELDNQAAALAAAGRTAAAAGDRREADTLRATATARAADAGVFGRFSIQDDLRRHAAAQFSIQQRSKALAVELSTGLDSPGTLNPDGWARQAEAIRDRIQGLSAWSVALLAALLLFTVGQVNTDRRAVFYTFMGVGIVVLLVGAIGGFTVDFFA